MVWLVLAALIIIVLGLIVWSPVEIELNTFKNRFQLRWKGLLGVSAVPGVPWHWYYQIFSWRREWRPSSSTARKNRASKPKSSSSPSRLSFAQGLALVKKLFRAVQVKKFYLDWDTGDYLYNAYLYPLTHALQLKHGRFKINFAGRRDVNILLQVRLCRLAWAYLQVLFHFK